MECIKSEAININPYGGVPAARRVRAIIVADEAPASLSGITGADVDGLDDNDILAVGSMIITPSADYVAFEDGNFTEKDFCGGGGGGGGDSSIFTVDAEYSNGVGRFTKTAGEILEAAGNGRTIVVRTVSSDPVEYTWVLLYCINVRSNFIEFEVDYGGSNPMAQVFYAYSLSDYPAME